MKEEQSLTIKIKSLTKKIDVWKILLIITLISVVVYRITTTLLQENQIPITHNAQIIVHITRIFGIVSFTMLFFVLFSIKRKNISYKSLLKIITIIFVFNIFSLVLWKSQNINSDSKNSIENIVNSNFINGNYIWLVELTIVLFIFFSLLSKILIKIDFFTNSRLNKLKEKFFKDKQFNGDHVYIFFISILIVFSNSTIELIRNFYLSNIDLIDGHALVTLYSNILLILFFSILISAGTFFGFSQLLKGITGKSLIIFSSLGLAFIFNYLLQNSISDGSQLNGLSIIPGANVFQILLFFMICLFVYLLVNRYVFATGLITLVFGIFIIANKLKFNFRQEPVYISDFAWLKQIGSLLGFIKDDIYILIGGICLIVLIIVLCFVLSKKIFKGKIFRVLERVGGITVIGLSFIIIGQNFKAKSPDRQIPIPIITDAINLNNKYVLWQGNSATANLKSLSFVWLRQVTGTIMEEPKGYSKQSLNKVIAKYEKRAEEINKERTNNISNQTVIYILSESLANPNRVPTVEVSKNPLPNIDSVKESQSGGLMISNGYGGGTANMEAQSLFGLPFINFGSSVNTIYTDVLPKMSYVPSISDLFKNRIVIHPFSAQEYDRSIVYHKLAFNNFYALTGGTDKLKQQEYFGNYVSDKQAYSDTLEKIDAKKSQFINLITIQNHVPWSVTSNHPDILTNSDALSATENSDLINYTNQISVTDKETQDFLNQLKKINKKITVVFYGDHLPGLYPTKVFKTNPQTQFETDYFIWTNDGSEAKEQKTLGTYSFSAQMLQVTNSKVSPFYALQTDLANEVPADDTKGLTPKQEQIVEDMKLVQYDLTAGKNYIKRDSPFYKVEK